ncbi:MAG TPA: hypothetical protein VJN64_10520 [Terriglobales bacterium]|nr:hypothetical protein [Terriglobales bacterium]
MKQHTGKISVSKQVLENVQYLRVQKRWLGKLARSRRAGENENSRSNNGADPQCRERPRPQRLFKPVARLFRIGNQLVNGLPGEKLAGQKRLL